MLSLRRRSILRMKCTGEKEKRGEDSKFDLNHCSLFFLCSASILKIARGVLLPKI